MNMIKSSRFYCLVSGACTARFCAFMNHFMFNEEELDAVKSGDKDTFSRMLRSGKPGGRSYRICDGMAFPSWSGTHSDLLNAKPSYKKLSREQYYDL